MGPLPTEEHRIFYQELLPTLGDAAVPLLLAAFRPVADQQPMYMVDSIIEAICSFDQSHEVPQFAAKLLHDDSPRRQRAALRLLVRRPAPQALDRIWEIHKRMQQTPDEYEADAHILQSESFPALLECAKLHHNWIMTQVESASPDDQFLHDLVYIVANIEDNGRLWSKLKPQLLQTSSSKTRRAIALNIGNHRDIEETELLIPFLRERADGLASAALRALSFIAPHRAVDEIFKVDIAVLAISRHMYLPMLLQDCPGAIQRQLLTLMKTTQRPHHVALAYGDFEDDMDCPTIAFLMGELNDELACALSDHRNPTPGAVHHIVRLLSNVNRIELLHSFSTQQHETLERRLAAYLLSTASSHESLSSLNEMRPGLKLLRRIGGPQYPRVINQCLRNATGMIRFNLIPMAICHHNSETVKTLHWIATAKPTSQGDVIAAKAATNALATLGETDRLIEAVMAGENGNQDSLIESVRAVRPFTGPAIENAFSVLRSGSDEAAPGAIMALAVAGRNDASDLILKWMQSAQPDSSLALACTRALGILRDSSGAAVDAIIEQLVIEPHAREAMTALLRIGSLPALAAR
jgi:hypothetical protein